MVRELKKQKSQTKDDEESKNDATVTQNGDETQDTSHKSTENSDKKVEEN